MVHGLERFLMESEYVSMEKDLLISMIHFLVKREDDLTTQNRMISERIAELAQALPSRE